MSRPWFILRAILANERTRARELDALMESIYGDTILPAAPQPNQGEAAPSVTIPAEQPASPSS